MRSKRSCNLLSNFERSPLLRDFFGCHGLRYQPEIYFVLWLWIEKGYCSLSIQRIVQFLWGGFPLQTSVRPKSDRYVLNGLHKRRLFLFYVLKLFLLCWDALQCESNELSCYFCVVDSACSRVSDLLQLFSAFLVFQDFSGCRLWSFGCWFLCCGLSV